MLAVTQDGHVVANLKYLVEPVRDVDDGDILLTQFLDDTEKAFNFALGDGCRRFIHNNDVRIGGCSLGDLYNLLLGHTKSRNFLLRMDGRLEAVHHGDYFIDLIRLSYETERRVFHSQGKVVLDGKRVNDVEFLVEGADSFLSGVLGITWFVIFAVQVRHAACSLVRAGQDLNQGRFPRTIFAHQAVNSIALDVKTYIINRPHAWKIFYEIADL